MVNKYFSTFNCQKTNFFIYLSYQLPVYFLLKEYYGKIMMKNLYQTFAVEFTPSPRIKLLLPLSLFLFLFRNEDDFFKGEQNDTKLMIIHLRKFFYDAYRWNRELICGAAKIHRHYKAKMVLKMLFGGYLPYGINNWIWWNAFSRIVNNNKMLDFEF